MITEKQLSDIAEEQASYVFVGNEVQRRKKIGIEIGRIIVVSGVRRCGKSTYLKQMFSGSNDILSINFEDPRLDAFEI